MCVARLQTASNPRSASVSLSTSKRCTHAGDGAIGLERAGLVQSPREAGDLMTVLEQSANCDSSQTPVAPVTKTFTHHPFSDVTRP